jgi:hypothetical protein
MDILFKLDKNPRQTCRWYIMLVLFANLKNTQSCKMDIPEKSKFAQEKNNQDHRSFN